MIENITAVGIILLMLASLTLGASVGAFISFLKHLGDDDNNE